MHLTLTHWENNCLQSWMHEPLLFFISCDICASVASWHKVLSRVPCKPCTLRKHLRNLRYGPKWDGSASWVHRVRALVSISLTLKLILGLHETDMHYGTRTSGEEKLRTCTPITIKWHQTRAVTFSWSGSKIKSERRLCRAAEWLVNKRS